MTESAVAAIRRHAVEAYPFECCGALIGTSSDEGGVSIAETEPLPNVIASGTERPGEAETSGASVSEPRSRRAPIDEGPRRRFLVSPADYQQAEAHAAAAGRELVGFYHSHPDHPAIPSQYDLDHAWPNLSYVIVSVRNGTPVDLRSWRLRPDRSGFQEEKTASARGGALQGNPSADKQA